MSSPKLIDTTTEQVQIPSILNNNYMKIGGAVVVFIIFVIILYFSFTPSTQQPLSTPPPSEPILSQAPIDQNRASQYGATHFSPPSIEIDPLAPPPPIKIDRLSSLPTSITLEVFTKCNYTNINTEKQNKMGIFIENKYERKFENMYIQSVKGEIKRNNGVVITLYSNPDCTGEEMIISQHNIINIECLEKPMRSFIIKQNYN